MHVGLVWRVGDALKHRDDPYRRRAIPLRELEPIVTMPGTTCHALDVGEAAAPELAAIETMRPLTDVSMRMTDFLSAATLMCALDVIVTVDTAFAHLAGALGRPAFLMLPYCPDWRWGRHATILGYPTVRPFRQPAPGDWASVIADVQDALRGFVQRQPPRALAAV